MLLTGAKALLLRTSSVYAAPGHNLAKTMLRLATERDSLNVVAGPFGTPIGAALIADVTALMLRQILHANDSAALAGIYHLAAAGETAWHSFARYVLLHAENNGMPLKISQDHIRAIAIEGSPLPAPRPYNSRLALGKLEHVFQF